MYWGFKWSTVKIPVLRRGDGRASYKAREIHAHPRLPPPLLSLATSLLLGGEGDSKVSTVIHRTKRYTLL